MIEGLLFDEARAFISNLEARDIEYWMAWKEEWPDWRPVTDVEGLTEMIFRAMHVSPPPPPKGTNDISVVREFPTAKPEVTGSNTLGSDSFRRLIVKDFYEGKTRVNPNQESTISKILETTSSHSNVNTNTGVGDFVIRSNKRFNKRMQITVLCNEMTFKTFSKDISVGGINLEEGLPDWVTGTFKVRIQKPNAKQQIELNCCAIEETGPGLRHRIQILPLQSEQDEKNLETWLAA